jgi:hypothetical protein
MIKRRAILAGLAGLLPTVREPLARLFLSGGGRGAAVKRLALLFLAIIFLMAPTISPPQNVAVTFTPSSSVPPPAAAAGFTSPVINADFTTPGNFWSNTADYITNCGAASSVPNQPSTWHFSNTETFTNN